MKPNLVYLFWACHDDIQTFSDQKGKDLTQIADRHTHNVLSCNELYNPLYLVDRACISAVVGKESWYNVKEVN